MKKENLTITNLYSLDRTISKELLEQYVYPWEVLPHIKDFILKLGETLSEEEYVKRGPNVWVHKTAKVFPSAYLGENIIVGKGAEIRHCAFVRENAIIGDGATVGNSTELKNVILFESVEVPHYNYVGDSILGYKVHVGAGTILSNCRLDKKKIKIENYPTNLNKLGSIIGENVEIGCSSVLNPGTIIHSNIHILPLKNVKGIIRNNICVE